ncbi:MAG: hypothetical protein JSS61_03930 [Verrucomicrobia bacterium]|nr:hypothetical protein [Verrucomicrobiota bacterium]
MSTILAPPCDPLFPAHLITFLPDESLPAFIQEQAELLRQHFETTPYTLTETIGYVTELAKENGLPLPADGDITRQFISELFRFQPDWQDPFAVVFFYANTPKALAFAQEAKSLWDGPVKEAPTLTEHPLLPLRSYTDLVFMPEMLHNLPDLVLTDVMHHLSKEGLIGKVEKAAYEVLKKDSPDQSEEAKKLRKRAIQAIFLESPHALGEKILTWHRLGVKQEEILSAFNQFPKDGRFYQYVYEQAKHAGIEIADWDQKWAENHWKDPEVIPHSIQALKRYLHT